MKALLLSLSVWAVVLGSLSAQQYMVQLAVYDQPVADSHFGDVGARIYHSKDKYGFHRYFAGKYSFEEATAASSKFRTAGYLGVEVVGEGEFNSRCSCFLTDSPSEVSSPLQLRSIFFDFDSAALTAESRERLDRLVRRLRENPDHTVSMLAHTDSKGSNAYNEALSQRRADAAKRYVTGRGISASRIDASTFGERSPIARNAYESGQDAAQGRQLNRRVELIVRDASGNALDIVEAIDVPTSLQD